jgi:hypothetical protein
MIFNNFLENNNLFLIIYCKITELLTKNYRIITELLTKITELLTKITELLIKFTELLNYYQITELLPNYYRIFFRVFIIEKPIATRLVLE